MGKPSSNNQNNSDTPSSINSISSKMSGLGTCEILETTPKLSLKLRPKALIHSEQNSHQLYLQNNNQDKRTSEGFANSNQYQTLADNNHTISHNNKDFSPSHNNDASRIPLPVTEIEPSWSRDSNINPKEKKIAPVRGKPVTDATVKHKELEHLGIQGFKKNI